MKTIESPCLGCERRSVCCWDRCDDYKQYKARLEEAKEQDREYRKQFKGNYRHYS